MMISETGTCRGYTILEILVSISIAMILLGIGIAFSFQSIRTEEKLERIAGTIETEVRKASMAAAMGNKDVPVSLKETAINGVDLKGAKLSLLHPGRFGKWLTPPLSGYRWIFKANGLSEPLRLRITLPRAEATLSFDPLTGLIRDRTITIAE